MENAAITGNTAVAAVFGRLQTIEAVQTAVMRQTADSRQQLAALLDEAGIGQTIDIKV